MPRPLSESIDNGIGARPFSSHDYFQFPAPVPVFYGVIQQVGEKLTYNSCVALAGRQRFDFYRAAGSIQFIG